MEGGDNTVSGFSDDWGSRGLSFETLHMTTSMIGATHFQDMVI